MIYPIDNLGAEPLVYNPQTSRYISQQFGGKWYLKQDTEYYGKVYPKGTEFNSIFGFLGHNGTDFASPKNTPIRCVQSGWLVEQTTKETGYGNRLCILTPINGKFYLWVYGHADHFATEDEIDWNFNKKDTWVKEGSVIAFVGNSGFSTGYHLHLGVYEYDKFGNKLNSNNGFGGALDPLKLIKEQIKMSNVKLVKNGNEYGWFLPQITEDSLKSSSLNYGYPLPTKDEKIDWSKVVPDLVIK